MNVKELYDIIQQLAASERPCEAVSPPRNPSPQHLRQLHAVIALVAAEGCRTQGGTFGNLFSQVDFVCKHFALSPQQRWAVQQARLHSNGNETLTNEDFLYDLRAVTTLISAVFHEDVPGTLLQILPPASSLPSPSSRLTVNRRYVRCIVRSFDDTTITADTEDSEILVDYANTEGGRDFAYLRKILREGMQLNLLDCHEAEQIHSRTSHLVPRTSNKKSKHYE